MRISTRTKTRYADENTDARGKAIVYWMILLVCTAVMYAYLANQGISTVLVFTSLDLSNMDITVTQAATLLLLVYTALILTGIYKKERRNRS